MILLAEMDEEAPTLFGPPPPFPPKQVPQPTPMRSGFEPDPVGVRTDPILFCGHETLILRLEIGAVQVAS